jgi:glutamate carboxypeptidase
MYKSYFSEIDKLQGKYADFLEDICNIESPTSYKAGVDSVLDYCLKYARGEGYKTEVFSHEISGDVALITMNPGAKGEPILLSAHMDTVHPVGSFGTPAVRRDGENMYGPGVLDCKGGIAAAFLAMKALCECGYTSRPVKLFLQSDEENSSITSDKKTISQMVECSRGAVAFINLEGHVKDTAVITRKGIIRYKFTVRGKALHSARCAYAASAVAEAAYKIIELEKMKDVEGLTCNCVIAYGGDAPNTVPERCVFTADIRFVSEEELETAKSTVFNLASKCFVDGCVTEVDEVSFRPAMAACERNDKLLEKLNFAYEKCSLPILSPRFCVGGSDAAYITEAGIPCVDSLGTEGGNIHSVREFIRLSSIAEAAKRIVAAALYL